MSNRYTFGDDDRAAARLLRLAQTYEPLTRDLLVRGGAPACGLAVDLGCGVGWSTRLLREVLHPVRTVGLDASERFIAEARRRHGPELEFELHDVTRTPFPVGSPDLLLCRFLLTHLRDTGAVLSAWAAAASPRARLLVHETESLSSPHRALARYYELVERLQGHYGQALHIGARLDEALARSPWQVIDSRAIVLEIPATRMAELHLANLRTWRTDEYAKRSFDGGELDELERTLERIVTGEESAARCPTPFDRWSPLSDERGRLSSIPAPPRGTGPGHADEALEVSRPRPFNTAAARGPRMPTTAAAGSRSTRPEDTTAITGDYVHGYSDHEGARLADQASTLAELLHGDTRYPAGSSVLEAGCGVGAQTVILARNSPGARFTCIDLSAESLDQARLRARGADLRDVTFARADIFDLPFRHGSFDHVFVCFVLEHLAEPGRALQLLKMRLKPGGTLTVIEGDHGSTFFHPEGPNARRAIQCLVELQARAHGDALIGRKLFPLLTGAGFSAVAVSPRMVYVDASRQEWVEGFTKSTFTAMVEGVREPALALGLMDPRAWDDGIAELRRAAGPDGVFCYTFFKAVGVR